MIFYFSADGGDNQMFRLRAKEIAPIRNRLPNARLCSSHGRKITAASSEKNFPTWMAFASCLTKWSHVGADFIKIMASGIMDF
jgi:hypothetical protein